MNETVFNCPYCEKSYNRRSSLHKHEQKNHKEFLNKKGRQKDSVCQICGKSYTHKYNLKRHERAEHGIGKSSAAKKKDDIRCEFCNNTFALKANLQRHWMHIHKKTILQCDTCKKFKCLTKESMRTHVQTCFKKKIVISNEVRQPRKRESISCPLCNVSVLGTKNILHHIGLDHQKDMSFQVLTFETQKDFHEWKRKEEESVRCSFIKKSHHQNHKGVSITLTCNRSGSYNESATKRRSRFVGTKKINKYCPAQIKALYIGDKVNVRYLKTHLGHDLDNKICHMNLSADERNAIVVQLKKNIPPRTILKTMKYPLPKLKSEYRRIHLLTLRDIRYIGKKYGIYKKRKEYKSEEANRKSWFEANKQFVLFHKKSSFIDERYPFLELQDFVLILLTEKQKEMLQRYGENWICIDSTNGQNVYDFSLTTIMVLDETNFVFPVAFMLSNKVDESVLTVLFQELKNEIGTVVLNTFMSDLSDEYVNAWLNVFPEPRFRFFSPWHICKAWRDTLNAVSFDDLGLSTQQLHDLKKKIYHFLRVNLLQEMNEEVFVRELRSFLEPHRDLLDFQKTFKTKYVPQKERWASCFWKYAGLDGNRMVCGPFHKILKYTLCGNKTRKLEKVPNILMEYLNLKLEDEILEEKKGTECRKIAAVKSRHKKSLRRSCDNVSEVEHGWIVEASTKNDEKETDELRELYYVQKTDSNNVCTDCPLNCAECDSCIHQYKCTCMDYRFFGNMCKHIHLVCRYLALRKAPDITAWCNIISDMPVLHAVTRENSNLEDDVASRNLEDATSQTATSDDVRIYTCRNEYENIDDAIVNEHQELLDKLARTVQSASAESKMKVLEELARKMDLVICTEEEVLSSEENNESQKYLIETIVID